MLIQTWILRKKMALKIQPFAFCFYSQLLCFAAIFVQKINDCCEMSFPIGFFSFFRFFHGKPEIKEKQNGKCCLCLDWIKPMCIVQTSTINSTAFAHIVWITRYNTCTHTFLTWSDQAKKTKQTKFYWKKTSPFVTMVISFISTVRPFWSKTLTIHFN